MLSKTLITYSKLFLAEIDKNDIKLFLESSPLYPSLLSAIQTLQYAGLNAQAGQCDWDYLKEIDIPLLLHLKSGKYENLAIAKWDSKLNGLKCYNLKEKRWVFKSQHDLKDYWNGVVIYTNNQLINKSRMDIKTKTIFSILCLILIIVVYFHLIKVNIIFYMPVVFGTVVSGCLYFKSEMPGSIIERLCHISTVADCERVEQSSYSSLLGRKMSCLALSFFLSQLISLVIGYILGIRGVLYSLYSVTTLVSLPIIAYSIYGQLKIRKICPLCVLVLICVVVEAIFFINWSFLYIELRVLVLYSGIFLTTVNLLQYVRNTKQKEYLNRQYQIDLLKLKRKNIMQLSESTFTSTTKTPIWFGEMESESVITIVISPHCIYCRNLVAELITLKKKGLKFKWNIVLGQTTLVDDKIIEIWILRYFADKDKFFEDLSHWSNGGNQLMSEPSYHNPIDGVNVSEIKHSFEKEIRYMNISRFPRIILNGGLLPTIYTVKDIEFILLDNNIKIE